VYITDDRGTIIFITDDNDARESIAGDSGTRVWIADGNGTREFIVDASGTRMFIADDCGVCGRCQGYQQGFRRRWTQVCTWTSHNIDCFLGSFCSVRAVFRLNCLKAQPSYEGRAAVEGGR
jgi:hypothetical protein